MVESCESVRLAKVWPFGASIPVISNVRVPELTLASPSCKALDALILLVPDRSRVPSLIFVTPV